jgi:hypothetical protein
MSLLPPPPLPACVQFELMMMMNAKKEKKPEKKPKVGVVLGFRVQGADLGFSVGLRVCGLPRKRRSSR